jgi:hypothetical protein
LDAIFESWNIFAKRSLLPSFEANEKLLTQHFIAHNISDTATSSFEEKTEMKRKKKSLQQIGFNGYTEASSLTVVLNFSGYF